MIVNFLDPNRTIVSRVFKVGYELMLGRRDRRPARREESAPSRNGLLA